MSTNTPRLRSAYPSSSSPVQSRPSIQVNSQWHQEIRNGKPGEQEVQAPLIPFSVLDAPSQRFYIIAVYLGLMSWRLFDWWKLFLDESDSLWLFMKWVAIDSVFLYGLPSLSIPWMEWSSSTTTLLFLTHAVADAFLMFQIPIPILSWMGAILKLFYDRELAVSEISVNPATLLKESHLILGKQIVNVLPEGSAVLNPDQFSFCLDAYTPTLELPIRINQTTPVLIELERIDLDSGQNETITISRKQLKSLRRAADKLHGKKDSTTPRTLQFVVKQTGLYRLQKVVDESNLEVRRRLLQTLVVQCPSASIKTVEQHKCRGELSDFSLQIHGTPPLKIRYRKIINQEDQSKVFLTVHPGGSGSPLLQTEDSDSLVKSGAGSPDVSWARAQDLEFPINEILNVGGDWQYSIDEVHDGCGNIVNYTYDQNGPLWHHEKNHLTQVFLVHERPTAQLDCSAQHPLKTAKGSSKRLPVVINLPSSSSRAKTGGTKESSEYHIQYAFAQDLNQDSDDQIGALIHVKSTTLRTHGPGPEIKEPGTYTLQSVASEYCNGEVLEPSTCVLENPPKPDLSITYENISDKCAGNSIGMTVDLDFTGTPPFEVSYVEQDDHGPVVRALVVDKMRSQIEIKPSKEGSYKYQFIDITDALHPVRSIKEKNLILRQDVKPPASASFVGTSGKRQVCNGESVQIQVHLSGQPPWILEYEHFHNGRRKRSKIESIETAIHTIELNNLISGGTHSLALLSVTDQTGCKVSLDAETTVEVRRDQPSVAFGRLAGRQDASILEGKTVALPLRLTGTAPWTVKYRMTKADRITDHIATLERSNDALDVSEQGQYELVEVHDAACPGAVDIKHDHFDVTWIPRPTLQIANHAHLLEKDDTLSREPVCEGDQDSMEILLAGNPPYQIKYEIRTMPERGSVSIGTKKEMSGSSVLSIRMETTKAGKCEYKFMELGDQSYNHDHKRFKPLLVQQTVYGRPSATFLNAGKTYSYCREDEAGDELVPVDLVGTPPFSLEVGIRQHTTAKPEIVNVPHIEGTRYNFLIPHRVLALGMHTLSIRKVRDANGCERVTEFDSPTVRVNVVDMPSIAAAEKTEDYCVGDRISYTLSGTPPFHVFYTFDGSVRKAAVSTTNFRRVAERPGNFTITAVSDKASSESCRAPTSITKLIHPMPSVKISQGHTSEVDIHEGGSAELFFEFAGTPPFEFTYTRSSNVAKGKKSVVLETKNDVSAEHAMSVIVSQEGTYEVVSIRDRFCGFSMQKGSGASGKRQQQQLLAF